MKLTTNTTVTIGTAVSVVLFIAGVTFKAGQYVGEFEGVKSRVTALERIIFKRAPAPNHDEDEPS